MPRFGCTIAALLIIAHAPVHGADGNSRYVPIPVEGILASLFKERLQATKADAPLWKLWNDIQRDPTKFKLDPAILNQFDLNNPALRGMLKELNEKHSAGAPLSPQDLAGLSKVLKDAQTPRAVNQVLFEAPTGEAPMSPAGADMPLPPDAPRADKWDRWMRDLMNHAENTEFGDWLRASPAFQKGIGDFRHLIDFNSNPSAWGLDALPKHLRFPDTLNFRLGDGLLSGLKNISMPDLPRVELPHVNLPSVHLGNWSLPTPPMPNIGGMGGAASIGQGLLWILIIGVGIMLVWQVTRNLGARGPRQAKAPVLGPWPVDPRKVATRGQLIQAFDYLALLLLGTEARSWNHRAIARKMLDANLRPGAVEELAILYEHARYTRGPEPLPERARAAARAHLCLLAEVPAS
jgi:hypothetical protein